MTPETQKPTVSELEILRILWACGPSTVREVQEALSKKKRIGYTSVLKLMQIMTEKGSVRRNEDQRAQQYNHDDGYQELSLGQDGSRAVWG